MNCWQCRDEFGAYLEGLLDEPLRLQAESHLAACSGCRAELREMRQLVKMLSDDRARVPSVSLENAVIHGILREQAVRLRRLEMRRRIRMLGVSGVAAAAVLLFAISSFWPARPPAAERTAAEVLAQGAEAMPAPSTVHIVATMRTLPADNFSMIGDKYDFVPVKVWKQFGDEGKWRIEKPGRVAVMDGKSTTMLIRPDYVVKFPRPSQGAFDTGWLLALANVQDMVTHELRSAQARGWEMKLTHETTGSGEQKLVVTVEAKSGLPAGDYIKNKFFQSADMRRMYRFDEKTKRLEGFDAYLHHPGGDVLVLRIEKIKYDQPFEEAVFALELPKTAVFYKEPQRLPDNEKYEKMTPEEAARTFFEACQRKDWNEVEKFFPRCDERLKRHLGGLQLLRLGTPFQSKGYAGWIVPYEIKLSVTVPMMACNDHPGKRYIVLPGEREVQDPKRLADLKARLAELKKLPDNGKYEKLTPKEAVGAFFDAMASQDAAEAQKLSLATADELKRQLQGPPLRDYRVGEPSFDEKTGFWQVPVTIETTRKHNLALRSDNPAQRYLVDGGI